MKSALDCFQQFLTQRPKLGSAVYVAEGAILEGDVTVGDSSSIWYHAVLRGDINRIVVGHHTNIQDLAVVHLAEETPCLIGNYVTIGHSAIVHACRIEDESLIGMGAVVLDQAVIGTQCLVGARSLVTQRTRIPPGSLVLGAPAKVVRSLTDEERKSLRKGAEHYVANAAFRLKAEKRAS